MAAVCSFSRCYRSAQLHASAKQVYQVVQVWALCFAPDCGCLPFMIYVWEHNRHKRIPLIIETKKVEATIVSDLRELEIIS